MICLISRPLLIASRRDWHRSKGLLKGFKLVLRSWESLKNWQRYDQMKFMTHPVKEKAQEGERRLRRMEEEKAVCMAKPQEAQQEWRRSLVAELRRRAKEHYGKGVLEKVYLLELG